MSERIKEVALDEAEKIKSLTNAAVRSGAYTYPIQGIWYFLSHRELWKPLISRLIPTMSVGLGITTAMFVFTYVPQLAVMAFTSGPLAPFTAGLLVLSESSTLATFISKALIIDEALLDTFDGTLISRKTESLVSEGRLIKGSSSSGDSIARLGKALKKPLAKFTPTAFIRYLMYLPLNFIPVVGTMMFVLLQGKKAGPAFLSRYFQLKGWNKSTKEEHLAKNQAAYTSFGVTATLLEMIPFVGLFFTFTNTTGAALWAADMEKGKGARFEGTAPQLKEKAKKAL